MPFIHEPNKERNHKILKVLENCGYKVNPELYRIVYQNIYLSINGNIEGSNESPDYVASAYKPQVTLEEFLLRDVIEHPEIKIGCQDVIFQDDGTAIECNKQTITFKTVEEIYNHMVSLRENK